MTAATFAISVTGAPFSTQSHQSALRFVEAIYAANHRVKQVFFYGDAVYVASTLNYPPSDEVNLTNAWLELAKKHDFSLGVCVAAATRRGILCAEEAAKIDLPANLKTGFDIVGVGSFMESLLKADRNFEFKG